MNTEELKKLCEEELLTLRSGILLLAHTGGYSPCGDAGVSEGAAVDGGLCAALLRNKPIFKIFPRYPRDLDVYGHGRRHATFGTACCLQALEFVQSSVEASL